MPVETFPIPFKALLEGGSLCALFQPIVDNRTGAVHGYEALIRGPSDGPLHSPHVLFAVAQQEGLLVQLDRICAQTQLARFAELELPGRLFVNLTPQSLFGAELSPARLSELTRAAIMLLYASRYGRNLYGRRAVASIMKSDFLTVRADTPLHELSERITTESEALPEDDLVATAQDGQFVGTVTLVDLLRAITSLRVKAARYANPLTLLPGNVPINEQIDALLADSESFTVAYADLDNFKPFNDIYGYARGDDVLRFVAAALTETVGSPPRTPVTPV